MFLFNFIPSNNKSDFNLIKFLKTKFKLQYVLKLTKTIEPVTSKARFLKIEYLKKTFKTEFTTINKTKFESKNN